jgi:cellulose synthase/poly-beta-1,6-N-acetylglucosamine synthase-like glycosyltransferase
MTAVGNPISPGFIARVQNILLKPKSEWQVIEREAATPQSLFLGYACILAAIPAIASLIGGLFPICVLGVCVSHNILFVVLGAVVSYIGTLVGTYAIGMIISMLAPSFGGQANLTQAMKVAVYSFTASWLAGVFAVWPPLSLLAILGLYSFYLMYLGLPELMKAPPQQALVYTIVAVVLGIVVFVVVGVVVSIVEGIGMAAPALGALPAAVPTTVTVH